MTFQPESSIVIAGGGLAGGLLAFQLRALRPDLRVQLFEAGPTAGGNHTWSFHSADVDPVILNLIQPLVVQQWDSYSVRFPTFSRQVRGGYHSITSDRMHEVLQASLGENLHLNSPVRELHENHIVLDSGSIIPGSCVINACGFQDGQLEPCGYQKFVGLDVQLSQPHGLQMPILVDATCEQKDGFRFFYILPWDETRLLVEDTRYSDSAELEVEDFRFDIIQYIAQHGWKLKEIKRMEAACIPLPLANEFRKAETESRVPAIGVRAGLFHRTTGYSFPIAARMANELACLPELTTETAAKKVEQLVGDLRLKSNYFVFLNRMMFRAAQPDQRIRIFERFYRLNEKLLQRFYAAQLSWKDQGRIFAGKPPTAVLASLKTGTKAV